MIDLMIRETVPDLITFSERTYHMNKKTILLTASVCALSLAVTGCSGKGGSGVSKYLTLGEYKDLEVDRIVTTITDEMVQEEIDNELYFSAEYVEITDRASKTGDTVNIDYEGKIDGEEFDGGSDTDCELVIGDGMFLEDFENALVGIKKGEKKEFELTFPEDYGSEFDGQKVTFTVTVNSITEVKLPEYNDEYVKSLGDYASVAEYEEDVKSSLQESYDSDSDYQACADALLMAIENTEFKGYPEDMYKQMKETVERPNREFAKQFGIDVADLFGEDYDIETDIMDTLHERLVVLAIAEKEKMEVSDEEYKDFVNSYWEMYGYESAEDFEESYTEDAIKYELLYDQVLSFLGEHTRFRDVSEEEYYADMEDDVDYIEEISDEDADPDEIILLDEEAETDEDGEEIEVIDMSLEDLEIPEAVEMTEIAE